MSRPPLLCEEGNVCACSPDPCNLWLIHLDCLIETHFGGTMPRKQYLLMSAVVLCFAAGFVTPVFSQGRGQAALPEGPGKEQVQMQCTKCHALGLITNAGG